VSDSVQLPDGTSLHVVDGGGSGPAVLAPTGGGVAFYENTFSPALKAALRLIHVEMRGTGGSTGTIDGATFASLADDLEAVRAALGLERPFVMGHSNHGCIAIEYGLRHAAQAAGVIAVGSSPDFSRAFSLGQELWAKRAPASAQERLAANLAAFDALDTTAMDPDEEMLQRYLALSPLGWRDHTFDAVPTWGGAPRGLGAYMAWMMAFGGNWDVTPRLAELTVPVFALSGRHDYLCPVELWEGCVDRAPGGRLVVFEHSAHNPQYEEAEAFDRELLGFVR
jgi:proline iminopeptidase